MISRDSDTSGARRASGNRPAVRRTGRESGATPKSGKTVGATLDGYIPTTRYFHQRALQSAWRPFAERSLSHWTTIIVIALSLTIYGIFSLLLVNANTALNQWEDDNLITVFMKRTVERNQLLVVGKMIKSQPGVSNLLIISPTDALSRLKGMMGEDASLLDELEENPLPYTIEFKLAGHDRGRAATLAKEIGALSSVEAVSYDHQWADRLASLIRAIRYIGNILSFLLLAAVALIVSNTIKLTIIARRNEVEIMRFMGADDFFIKAPFIYEGLLQGLLGAGVALVFSGVLYLGAREALLDLGRSFGASMQLEFLPLSQLSLLVVIGATLGLSGAMISLSRFLDV